jgi:anti-anti-sigma regulatory factor
MRWANAPALELWRASSLEEFLARDFSTPSAATRTRLDGYMAALRAGGRVAEDWTLYPRGKPATMTLHGLGVELDDGRLAILFQAMQKETPIEPSMIRAAEALRHTSLMVSLINEQGETIFQNPAALRAFGNAPSIQGWFGDGGTALLSALRAGEVFQAELLVHLPEQECWHSLRATPVTDPVTGERAGLVQQLDIQKRREAEDLAAAQGQLVEELNRAVAVVERQHEEILMLSAPILDVGPYVLAVPVIGALTSERLTEIAQRLLPAIQAQRCRYAILDMTGCVQMDSAGAHGLSRLTAAVELLGAHAILTGISPVLAQAMVTAGIELSQFVSLRTLNDGFEYSRAALGNPLKKEPRFRP